MSLAAIQVSVELTQISCGECGGIYALNERYRAQKAQAGGGWHCPYCDCSWGYYENNENARLKKELESERLRKEAALRRANEAEATALTARRAATRAKNEKLRADKRSAAGVCQCCHRTFKQLAAHMSNKHPDFAK